MDLLNPTVRKGCGAVAPAVLPVGLVAARMTAAHRTLPLGSVVRVTNLKNGRSVVLRINDRGPYGRNDRKGTIIDVSKGAARRPESKQIRLESRHVR